MTFDKIIIGAGLYGLYSALFCGNRGENVLVLEYDVSPFKHATYVNQARIHMGYHYPRSYSTAIKSAGYFERFVKDYAFCVLSEFDQVYATSALFSWTNVEQFRLFCKNAGIMCEDINPQKYFKSGLCDGAFLTKEYTYDAHLLRDYFIEKISGVRNVSIKYGVKICEIRKDSENYFVTLENGSSYAAPFVLNATYASTNQILAMAGFELFEIKYELCEIILCDVTDNFKDVGLTVMDGPFFSLMPFGKTGKHSLTSVTFTPHKTSCDSLPTFDCQTKNAHFCSPQRLGNCNECPNKPESAQLYMSKLARKYVRDEYGFNCVNSMYSMKPILRTSEIDDSRPTIIRKYSEKPVFASVLSGKINTVYDLDDLLDESVRG